MQETKIKVTKVVSLYRMVESVSSFLNLNKEVIHIMKNQPLQKTKSDQNINVSLSICSIQEPQMIN